MLLLGSLCHALLYSPFNLGFFGCLRCVCGKGVSYVHCQWIMLDYFFEIFHLSFCDEFFSCFGYCFSTVLACFRMMKTSQ